MTKHVLAALITAFALAACNTMEGLGKDIAKADDKVEEAAKKK